MQPDALMSRGRALCVSAFFLFASTCLAQEARRQIVVLVSTDPGVIRDLPKGLKQGATAADLGKLFPGPRFVIKELEKDGLVLLDTKIALLAELARKEVLAKGLLDGIDASLTTRLSSLTAEQQAAISEQLNIRREEGADAGQAAVGLDAQLEVTIEGANGTTQTFTMTGLPHDQIEKRNQALRKHPMLSRNPTAEELKKERAIFDDPSYAGPEQIRFYFYGKARQRIADNLKRASACLEDYIRELQNRNSELGRKLLEKLGGGNGLKQVSSFGDLPAGVRDELLTSVKSGWKSYGFESEQDAESFMLNSRGVRAGTILGLAVTTRVGDPTTHTPSMGVVVGLFSVGGGIFP
jgi:hypothetical protein